jgi:hypothetical protein
MTHWLMTHCLMTPRFSTRWFPTQSVVQAADQSIQTRGDFGHRRVRRRRFGSVQPLDNPLQGRLQPIGDRVQVVVAAIVRVLRYRVDHWSDSSPDVHSGMNLAVV